MSTSVIKHLHDLSDKIDAAGNDVSHELLLHVMNEYREAAIKAMFRLGDLSAHCDERIFELEEEFEQRGSFSRQREILWSLYVKWKACAEDVFEQLSMKNEFILP